MNIKPCMGHISGTRELLLCEYWRKSMIIGEKNTDLKRLTGRLKLRFLTEIGRLHWNQGEEVAHFTWFGEPCIYKLFLYFYRNSDTENNSSLFKTDAVDLRRLLCEQVVCLITEKKEHTDYFPFSYIYFYSY